MKHNIFRIGMMTLAAVALMGMSSCKPEDVGNTDETHAANIVAQFVDHTVAPTYSSLATHAETLANQLAALREHPTQQGIEQACATFLAAREQWEKSEAFLFGAAGDFGIDPHIDSWPLDVDAFNTLMHDSRAMIAALDSDEGDRVAGDRLGNALLGFHGIEFILFENGHAKNVSNITENEWIYVSAVAGDLRNRCYQLEVSWIGHEAPQSHIDKLDELELPYTVASGRSSYGNNIKNAGYPGSSYASLHGALMAILQGCVDIADEVGTSKINAAYSGENQNYIESPYSYMSITDFHNNIISIQNVYLGGVEGSRDTEKSLQSYIYNLNASLDARIQNAITEALNKIDAMPTPFVLHYADSRNGQAVEACEALSEVLSEAITAISNNL